MAKVRQRKRDMVNREIDFHLQQYKTTGAELIMGTGRFVAPKTLEVRLNDGGTRELAGDQVFLNIGTHAAIPSVPDLEAARPLTHIEALELDYLPPHLIVLGGGYVSGVYEYTSLEAITEEHFHRHFNINVLGLLLATQAAVKYLGEGGSIINMGSVVSSITPPNSAVYSGTKAAVDAVTGVLARELGPKKIRVNTISPGIVETEGTHSGGFIGSEFEKAALAQTPLGRIGQPSDIASIAVFLASEDSAWLTGERLLASGGFR